MARRFDVGRIIKQATARPLAIVGRCRRELQKLEAGYHSGLRDIAAGAYAVAWQLKKEPAEWEKFLKKPFWKKAKQPKGDKGIREELHRVMLYVCSAVTDQAYDRAFKYARALEPYLVEKVAPEKVRQRIEKDRGLERLYELAKEKIPLRSGQDEEDQGWNDDDLTFDGEAQANDDEEGGESERNGDGHQKRRVRRRRLTLDIEISPEKLERVLSMAERQAGTLRFKALGAEGAWHRFRATNVKTAARSGGFGGVGHVTRRRARAVSTGKVRARRLARFRPASSSISAQQDRR